MIPGVVRSDRTVRTGRVAVLAAVQARVRPSSLGGDTVAAVSVRYHGGIEPASALTPLPWLIEERSTRARERSIVVYESFLSTTLGRWAY